MLDSKESRVGSLDWSEFTYMDTFAPNSAFCVLCGTAKRGSVY